MSSKVAKDRAARLARFRDAHEEYKETKNPEALKRRHEAMFSESHETIKRATEILACESYNEGQSRRDRLKKAKFTGWKKKES